jgi:serine/threonine protein kinase
VSEETRAASASPVPGSRIAGYVLEEQIGRGGMAVVFRAREDGLDRTVALKILDPVRAGDEEFRRRFIRESRAAAAVDDPHIIPVFKAGEADGVLYIAMRYVPGGDLGTLVRGQGPLPPARVAEIVSQVASVLDKAHRQGLVHRDVKPSNMLLDAGSEGSEPDHVYLSDFGLTKTMLGTTSLTRTGEFLGTFAYVAPEQIKGDPVGESADEYALACAAYELLCGSPPFVGSDASVLGGHLYQPPPRLTSRQPGLPPAVDAVFDRALAKDPAGRFPSCRELSDALRRALSLAQTTETAWRRTVTSGSAQMAAGLTQDRSGSGQRSRKRSRTAAVIAAVVAVAVAVGLLAWRPWTSTPPVLQPTGLTVGAPTMNSVTLSWSGPATGPAPDRYVIWQDSQAIGSVSGNVVSYQARGLASDTTYRYQIQAIRGSLRSPRSAVLTATTLAPPLSAARLAGTWATQFQVVQASSYDGFFNPVGRTWIAHWIFSPDCSAGACTVMLSGNIIYDNSFTAILNRDGAVYTAVITVKDFEYCDYVHVGTRYPIAEHITIRIAVSAAHPVGTAWTATAWSGTYTMFSPYTLSPTGPTSYCPAFTVSAAIHGG